MADQRRILTVMVSIPKGSGSGGRIPRRHEVMWVGHRYRGYGPSDKTKGYYWKARCGNYSISEFEAADISFVNCPDCIYKAERGRVSGPPRYEAQLVGAVKP